METDSCDSREGEAEGHGLAMVPVQVDEMDLKRLPARAECQRCFRAAPGDTVDNRAWLANQARLPVKEAG